MATEQIVDENENSMTEKKGKATPGRRQTKAKKSKNESQGNAITAPLYAVLDYFSNVRTELNKVAWPSREETRHLTILCINVTIISALALGALSLLLTEFVQIGLANSWILLATIAAMVGGAIYAMRRGYL